MFVLMSAVVLVMAQQPPPQSVPDQLAQCTALLRVKQDLPCRCDQVEQLAAAILRRAEKAEADVEQLRQQLTTGQKSGTSEQK